MPKPRPLTQLDKDLLLEYIRYDSNSGFLFWKKQRQRALAGDRAYTETSLGYIIFTLNSRIYKAHRVAWFLFYGEWPDCEIDHINGNKADNRICNLRKVTKSQNQHNRKRHRSGEFIGVYKDPIYNGWIASAPRNFLKRKASKYKYLGYFKTKEEAWNAVVKYCESNED